MFKLPLTIPAHDYHFLRKYKIGSENVVYAKKWLEEVSI